MKKAPEDWLVIEMTEKTLILNKEKKTVESLENFEQIDEDVWVVTDFNNTPPRFQWVEAPPQYAEILAQRQLQEAGELEDGAHIIPHWKKGRGKTASQIFFTAIPGKVYLTHENRANELETHYLLFPCNALLLACLNHFVTAKNRDTQGKTSAKKPQGKKKKKLQKTVAILFEHGHHVDMIVGRSGHVMGASRVSSFAETTDDHASLSSSVNVELQNIMEATPNDIDEIVYFNWLLPKPGKEDEAQQKDRASWVITLAKQIQAETNVLPTHRYTMAPEGTLLSTSLPEALQHLSDNDSSATLMELLAYRAQQFMPWAILITLAMVICLGITTVWLQVQNATLKSEILALKNLSDTVTPTRIKPINKSYKKVVAFVQNLERWQRTPSFWMLLSELSSARVHKLFFDRITIQFDKNVKTLTTLTGAIESSFQTANKDHEIFLSELTKRNFKVVKSKFATDVTLLTFEIKLERAAE